MTENYVALSAVRSETGAKRDRVYHHVKRLGIELWVGPDGRSRYMAPSDAERLRASLQGFRKPTPRKGQEAQG